MNQSSGGPDTDAPPLTVALALESDGPGGAEWMLIHLAVGLQARGHRVVPIIPAHGVGWLGRELVARGFVPRTFHLSHPFDLGCVARLRGLFLDEGISVLHAHEFTLSVFGTAAGILCGVPSIVTLHSAQGFPERFRRRVAIRWAARRAYAATSVSEATREQIGECLGVATTGWRVIQNGVPVPEGDRSASRSALGVAAETRLLLAVGNLYPVKGHDVLLRAMAAVAEKEGLPPWTVLVAGRGEEEEKLERLTRELGLSERVVFLGFRDDIGALLHAADLFVHPSRSEGLPLAIIEAMSVGLPVVASNVGGIGEAVAHGETGLLVPPENPEALAEAITELLRDSGRAREIGNAGRRAAVESYGLDRMVDRYLALYRAASR